MTELPENFGKILRFPKEVIPLKHMKIMVMKFHALILNSEKEKKFIVTVN